MNELEPLPISALEHHCYCPRQAALILVDGDWVDNAATTRGSIGHIRADTPGGRRERGRVVHRAIALWSRRWGLTGRADAIEFDDEGGITPVEYKIGHRHGDSAHVQLCAQALCLEEMTGRPIQRGALWFSATREREYVDFTDSLRNRTADVIRQVRASQLSGQLPDAVDDERCDTCQLYDRCLPTVCSRSLMLQGYVDNEVYRCNS